MRQSAEKKHLFVVYVNYIHWNHFTLYKPQNLELFILENPWGTYNYAWYSRYIFFLFSNNGNTGSISKIDGQEINSQILMGLSVLCVELKKIHKYSFAYVNPCNSSLSLPFLWTICSWYNKPFQGKVLPGFFCQWNSVWHHVTCTWIAQYK